MTSWLILLIIIVVILVVWWALMRNTENKPDFPLHHDESPAEHGTDAAHVDHAAHVEHAAPPVQEPMLRAQASQVEDTYQAEVVEQEVPVAQELPVAEELPLAQQPSTPAEAVMDSASSSDATRAALHDEPLQPLAPPAPQADTPSPAVWPDMQSPDVASPPVQPDDLIIIEGIGPKVNQLLQAAGIITFAQLAEADAEDLRSILAPAGLRMIDPASWPAQARLAADGKMAELQTLQDSLRAGRAQ